MQNSSSKEVDVEMSEINSDESDDYGIGKFLDEDSVSYSIHSSKTSSVHEMTANSEGQNFINHSFYNPSDLEQTKLEGTLTNRCNDYFDPEEMYKLLHIVGNTGDNIDSDESSRTCVESPSKPVNIFGKTRLDGRDLKIFNKTFFNSVSSSIDDSEGLKSKKPILSKTSISNSRKNTSKVSNLKDPTDMDSITLMIKVPKSKLFSHINEKTRQESRRSFVSKPTSSYGRNDSTKTQLKDGQSHRSCSRNMETGIDSLSDITSYIDQSKQIIKNYKESIKMSNKNLTTRYYHRKIATEKFEKETQTFFSSSLWPQNSDNSSDNFFLCNICHKIVPGTLPPVCMKLSCSAVTKCDLIFHSELDLIMHLPVKHTFEFETYKICIKCNLMYHPSNTVNIKGRCTCLDCLAVLVQLANE